MTDKDNLEKKLEKIGEAIKAHGSVVDDVMSRIEAAEVNRNDSRDNIWGVIMKYRAIKFSAAAAIIIAALISLAVLKSPTQQQKFAKEKDTTAVETIARRGAEQTGEKPDINLAAIKSKFAAGDIDGLVAILAEAPLETKVMAANFLAEVADSQAIEALEILNAELGAQTEPNPFVAALEKIESQTVSGGVYVSSAGQITETTTQCTITDVDGDGLADILFGLTDGRVIVYNTQMEYRPEWMQWVTQSGNFSHTGVWQKQ